MNLRFVKIFLIKYLCHTVTWQLAYKYYAKLLFLSISLSTIQQEDQLIDRANKGGAIALRISNLQYNRFVL